MTKTPTRNEMIAELIRLKSSNLVGNILFRGGTTYSLDTAPDSVVAEVWKKAHDRDCFKNQIDPATNKPMTRKALEKYAYRAKHKDFKGNGCLLVCRVGGTCSVPTGQMSDKELYEVLGVY
jgi:hypothetical protein